MKSKIRITKEFKFEMAHALDYHNGQCKNIHGHSYTLSITVLGIPQKENISEKGMVMDFGDLKNIINKQIINDIDHALMLQKDSPYTDVIKSNKTQKMKFVDYQPTCENMLIDFSSEITKHLPKNIFLFSLKLRETSTGYAEWFASDNN